MHGAHNSQEELLNQGVAVGKGGGGELIPRGDFRSFVCTFDWVGATERLHTLLQSLPTLFMGLYNIGKYLNQ